MMLAYTSERLNFDYEVFVHRVDNTQRIVGTSDVFGIDNFRELEHSIEGTFDDHGIFKGRIVAFGNDLGIKTFAPRFPISSRRSDALGAFSFSVGTFEVDQKKSTLDPNQHAYTMAQAEKFSGIFVFRDSLRVMPYGRTNADFLGLEERRGKHAGRYFWAHRRSFGRVGFTRNANPSLKDKAGREGLVDNRAFREMRLLIINLLIVAADKYFGTGSPVRDELLPGIMARKALQKDHANQVILQRKKGLREFLRTQKAPLPLHLIKE